VHSEVVDGLQESTVILPWLAPARLRRIKYFQHDRPIALRHSRQHGRLPDAGHAVIRTKPDSGIRPKGMAGIPSTQPSLAGEGTITSLLVTLDELFPADGPNEFWYAPRELDAYESLHDFYDKIRQAQVRLGGTNR
jgi:hypothetical protein